MDFTYHDTKDQERFRQDVCTWLSANLPPVLHDPQTCRKQDATTWDACRVFRRRLGDKGWLAPTEPAAWGGGELAPSQAVVLLEELEKRGLRELVDDAGASLREALHACGTEAQQEQFLLAIARGQLLVWRTAVEPEIELDPSILGVDAWTDGDDYVLHGEGRFVGLGLWPDYLWLVAVINADASLHKATASFLVPANLQGIALHTPRQLLAGEPQRITFDQTRVPRHCLLGKAGDGGRVMHDALLAASVITPPPVQDAEVADLLQYARETTRDGSPLSDEPVYQQLLMEAYINSHVTRLLRLRDAWRRTNGQPLTYHAAQTRLWEKRTARRLAEIVQEVVGIYALLDDQDHRAPAQGRFELQQRRHLAQQHPNATVKGHEGVMAACLALGQKPEPLDR